jgi:O-antigen ligase
MLPLLCIPVIARLEIYKYKIFWRILAGGFAFVVMLGVLYLVSSSIREVLNLALFAKGESYSSLERLKTITAAWGYFRSYPVLGVGWGSVTSHDLILMILANSGILGLGAFGLAASGIGWLVFRGIKDASHTSDRSRTIWFLSGIFLLFASTISEFPFVFGHLWVVAGMAIAASLRDYREPVLDKIE